MILPRSWDTDTFFNQEMKRYPPPKAPPAKKRELELFHGYLEMTMFRLDRIYL